MVTERLRFLAYGKTDIVPASDFRDVDTETDPDTTPTGEFPSFAMSSQDMAELAMEQESEAFALAWAMHEGEHWRDPAGDE